MNRDLFGNLNRLQRRVLATPGPVVLHFHVLHSYWLNLDDVVAVCLALRAAKPDVTLVWTLHDHWSVTGRCAFLDGCERWQHDCDRCPTLSNYPPVKIDRASQQVANKRRCFREMIDLGCRFISPSQHVATAFNRLYGADACRVINNGIDVATEAMLARLPVAVPNGGRPKIALVAHDLRYDGKTNQQLVNALVALGSVEVHTFGKFSPFSGANVVNHGFLSDKSQLMAKLNQMDALLFSSRVDNYPLILCEALSIGVPVIATHSEAAGEVLNKCDGKTVSETVALALALAQQSKAAIAEAIFGTDLAAFHARSRHVFSGHQMLKAYVAFYQDL